MAEQITISRAEVTEAARWDVKNLIERFVWTAIQGFFGSVPATLTLTANDARAWVYAGVTGAVAAVISLAKNLTAEGVRVQGIKKLVEAK